MELRKCPEFDKKNQNRDIKWFKWFNESDLWHYAT